MTTAATLSSQNFKAMKPKLPWYDRAGRFSRLKLSVFLLCIAPMLWMDFAFSTGLFEPKPITEIIHSTGDWAMRILLASLAITPLRHITMRPRIMLVRRMVGLTAAFYTFAHFLYYCADEDWMLSVIAHQVVFRFYMMGFIAFIGLIILTVTSSDRIIKRLGAARWQTIHKFVYALTVFAIIHFILISKLGATEALLSTDIFIQLMLLRYLVHKRIALNTRNLALLMLAMVVFAALSEAGFYAIFRNIDFFRVLHANVVFTNFRPSFGILIFGLSLIMTRLVCLPSDRRRNHFSLFGKNKATATNAHPSTKLA